MNFETVKKKNHSGEFLSSNHPSIRSILKMLRRKCFNMKYDEPKETNKTFYILTKTNISFKAKRIPQTNFLSLVSVNFLLASNNKTEFYNFPILNLIFRAFHLTRSSSFSFYLFRHDKQIAEAR